MNFSREDFVSKMIEIREAVDALSEEISWIIEEENKVFCEEHVYLIRVIHEGV